MAESCASRARRARAPPSPCCSRERLERGRSMTEFRLGRRGIVGPLVALLALAGSPAGAVPRVTQVIDGLPQVIAPQQIIVSCDPALPVVCSNALALVGATIVATGQAAFNLVQLPDGVSLQDALDTLRAAAGIASAEPNRIFLGSATYP